MSDDFQLATFTPYLLNRAAEAASLGFQSRYRDRNGMLRTEWRVLFHLGRYGEMTARDICDRAGLHKTKVSRAVAALEKKRFVSREKRESDRRQEALSLTRQGRAAFTDLCQEAQTFDQALLETFTPEERDTLRRCLSRMAGV